MTSALLLSAGMAGSDFRLVTITASDWLNLDDLAIVTGYNTLKSAGIITGGPGVRARVKPFHLKSGAWRL